ncbi:MAG: M28 family metallopeptidase [Promethearchaeota archaeon]
MIDEKNIKANLEVFTFPRLSGTIAEEKAFKLAVEKVERLNLNYLIQEFEFSTFYSRIYPKIIFSLGFLLILMLFLGFESLLLFVLSIIFISVLLILFILMRHPEKYKLYKRLKSANLYVKLPSINSNQSNNLNSDKLIIFMCHLDSKGQRLPLRVRVRAMRAWIFTSLILLIIILLKNIILPNFSMIFIIIGLLPMTINALSTVLILINTINNESPGASDNASGIACVLELMQFYSNMKSRLKNYDTWFVFTGCEETGTMGIRNFYKKIKDFEKYSVFIINFDGIGRSITIFDSIYKPNGYNELYNRFLNNNKGLQIFEKSKKINFGVHSDGTYMKNKFFQGIEFGDLSIYGYMHSSNDTIDKVNTKNIKILCELIIENLRDIDNQL